MNDYVPHLVLFGLFGGIAFLAGYAEWKRRRNEKEKLRAIARNLGLTFSEPQSKSSFLRLIGPWEMTGTYNRIPVRIYEKKVTVAGEGRTTASVYIDATVSCRRKCGLTITREDTLSRLGGALFGLQDLTTGNADLDGRVVVKGVPILIVQAIVGNVKFQQELMRLFEHNGTIYVDQHGAHFQYPSPHDATDEQKTRVIINALTRTAAALQEAAS